MSKAIAVVDGEVEKVSLRDRALAKVAQFASPGRVAAVASVVGMVSASTAFASGAGVGASSAATYITGSILPDVAIIATALMGLAAAIYGFKWLLSLVV
ncbi:MAG: hypothetical protein PHG39_05720 [Acidithiobacillus ferrooxidans]|nr:hypothetical protein [Acidithiobacillus ferrooxidans]MDD5003179.1 hypothetical protein [Acidithiobacillus sp.]MDD5378716.1 hypothetical protein [Acidithiobacillus sp.]MDD5576884.1 hypothetical protein [Acidithiobacillus sp.]